MVSRIDGSEIAQQIINRLKERPTIEKRLVAVLIGENPASLSFLRQKGKAALELGVAFEIEVLPSNISDIFIKDYLQSLAQDDSIGGIIVQLPLPKDRPTQEILDAIPIEKDIDVLSSESVRLFETGNSKVLPPAAATVEEIMRRQKFDPANKTVAVVGLGRLVGIPVVTWLKNKVGKLITIDINEDINQIKEVDFVISGAGKPQLISPNLLKEEAAVIDFGYGKVGDRTSGDLDVSDEQKLAKLSFYTPTPGGTGPILVAKLLENFYSLSEN